MRLLQLNPSEKVQSLKAGLDHPIVDGDGHQMEHLPVVLDFLDEVAGSQMKKRWQQYAQTGILPSGKAASVENQQSVMSQFWAFPTKNTLDRVTSTLPELLYRRLPEIGLDYSMIYPSLGLFGLKCPDDEMRVAMCRALNEYYAETFSGYRDRLEPVAVIPNFSPEEAIAELDHAVGELGLKLVVFGGLVPRTRRQGDGTVVTRRDMLGQDSSFDYDPVWERCVELGVVPTFHSGAIGFGTRTSRNNYVANHIGSFATGQEGICRSLVMGGVPTRFPQLKFAFLEGGVSWACQLFSDLVGHFEKRNRESIANYDPKQLDGSFVEELFETFGRGRLADGGRHFEVCLVPSMASTPGSIDDFAEAGISDAGEFVRIFSEQFFFGCEADDPLTGVGFNRRMLPGQACLNPMFGSDIGHWDVPDMRNVLPEAFELLEDGHVDSEQFRAFTCDNTIRMVTARNPKFFEGTAVESYLRS